MVGGSANTTGASGVQRQEKEVTVCWAPRAPGKRIRTCPDSQPPSSQQQGDEPPQQPHPQPPPQLKVWLSCRLEHNKTQSTTTLSPYAQGPGHTHTRAHTLTWTYTHAHTQAGAHLHLHAALFSEEHHLKLWLSFAVISLCSRSNELEIPASNVN